MAALCFLPSPLPNSFNTPPRSRCFSGHQQCPSGVAKHRPVVAPLVSTIADQQQFFPIDKASLVVAEATDEDQLWAAACLRVRSFNQFHPSTYGVEEHQRYLAEREFEAMKDRLSGKREGFKRVSCINASLPSSHLSSFSDDLCVRCKYTEDGEDRVLIGSLDLNQCLLLPEEIPGKKPEGAGAEFARAYLSNVCVAKELHRNGIGYDLLEKSKRVAEEWGITDIYVHVAVDNEAAKKLYRKCGFVYENDEPAWQARFLERPRRVLLWFGLSSKEW